MAGVIETLTLLVLGALLGVVLVFGTIIWLHDKMGMPIPAVDVAIIIYVTVLALAIGVPAYLWR